VFALHFVDASSVPGEAKWACWFKDRATYKQRYEQLANWGLLMSAPLGTCLRQVSRLLILGDDRILVVLFVTVSQFRFPSQGEMSK